MARLAEIRVLVRDSLGELEQAAGPMSSTEFDNLRAFTVQALPIQLVQPLSAGKWHAAGIRRQCRGRSHGYVAEEGNRSARG